MSPSLAAVVPDLNKLMLRQAQHEVLTLSPSKGEAFKDKARASR